MLPRTCPARIKPMAKVIVKLRNIAWRDGRPRFIPGARLRRLGYKGEDLKHPDGRWFGLYEAEAWANAKAQEIADIDARRAAGKRARAPVRANELVTVGELIEAVFAQPEFRGGASIGKRTLKPRADTTVKWYRRMADALLSFDAKLWASPAAAVKPAHAFRIYEKLHEQKGLAMARAIVALVRRAWTLGVQRGQVTTNPWLAMRMPTMAPRVRVGTFAEMRALVAAADALGRPEIGDCIYLGLFTGQRQNDRLALRDAARDAFGRRIFRQSKTGAIVSTIDAAPLAARLAMAAERRAAMKVSWPNVIIDETASKPFKPDHYRHVFGAVRATAVASVKDSITGAWLVMPCPSLADFQERDLRDTAVTWLADAGSTLPEIAAITGHSLASVQATLRHYCAMTAAQSDAAIGKLGAMLEARGAGL